MTNHRFLHPQPMVRLPKRERGGIRQLSGGARWLTVLALATAVSLGFVVAATQGPNDQPVAAFEGFGILETAGAGALTIESTPTALQSFSSPAAVGNGNLVTYVVRGGDTLSHLAEKYGVSADTIRWANDLKGDVLRVDQKLLIPPVSGVLYAVKEGDNVSRIAALYKVDVGAIVAANGLTDPDMIQSGATLSIPGAHPIESPRGVVSSRGGDRQGDGSTAAASYAVRAGDTLLAISRRLGVDADRIARDNALVEPFMLREGQVLQIPSQTVQSDPAGGTGDPSTETTRHVVVSGDTLFGVALLAGVPLDSVASLNGLKPPYLLKIGQEIIVPAGKAAKPVPAPAATPAPVSSRTDPTAASPAASVPTPASTATPAGPASQAPSASAATSSPVPAPQLAPVPQLTTVGARAADLAVHFRGYPYKWGGSSADTGFDCSGLVYYVYRQIGHPIPREMAKQINAGRRVGRNELQPGDIVFFQNTYMPGLSHDGIYLGNGRFVNARNEDVGVIISDLGEPYWAERYYAAVRP